MPFPRGHEWRKVLSASWPEHECDKYVLLLFIRLYIIQNTSSVCSGVHPGCDGSRPASKLRIRASHLSYLINISLAFSMHTSTGPNPFSRSSSFALRRPCDGVTSPMPIEKPRLPGKKVTFLNHLFCIFFLAQTSDFNHWAGVQDTDLDRLDRAEPVDLSWRQPLPRRSLSKWRKRYCFWSHHRASLCPWPHKAARSCESPPLKYFPDYTVYQNSNRKIRVIYQPSYWMARNTKFIYTSRWCTCPRCLSNSSPCIAD